MGSNSRFLCLRINSGLEGFLRIAGMLRRKRFDVCSVSMEKEEGTKNSKLIIGFCEENEFLRAKNFLEKLVDVTEIKEER
jgi:acetolactate synthase regulatory subunit